MAIVAPASPFDPLILERGAAELSALGFQPSWDQRVFDKTGYVAGSAAVRAEILTTAWSDPSIAAIFAVRGGYGSAQLLPWLDASVFRATTKPLIGCSDLTTLLVFLTTCCETVGFHGPMMVNLADGEAGYDRASLLGALTSGAPFGPLEPDGLETVRDGQASGPLLGGTLTQLTASLSTPYAFSPPSGYVLLLEDVAERPYRIDRMLTQLIHAGLVARASAVVCGEFPQCRDTEGRDARSVVTDLLRDFDGPIVHGFPTGHTAGPLWTVPVGVTVAVTTQPVPRVIVQEGAVR